MFNNEQITGALNALCLYQYRDLSHFGQLTKEEVVQAFNIALDTLDWDWDLDQERYQERHKKILAAYNLLLEAISKNWTPTPIGSPDVGQNNLQLSAASLSPIYQQSAFDRPVESCNFPCDSYAHLRKTSPRVVRGIESDEWMQYVAAEEEPNIFDTDTYKLHLAIQPLKDQKVFSGIKILLTEAIRARIINSFKHVNVRYLQALEKHTPANLSLREKNKRVLSNPITIYLPTMTRANCEELLKLCYLLELQLHPVAPAENLSPADLPLSLHLSFRRETDSWGSYAAIHEQSESQMMELKQLGETSLEYKYLSQKLRQMLSDRFPKN